MLPFPQFSCMLVDAALSQSDVPSYLSSSLKHFEYLMNIWIFSIFQRHTANVLMYLLCINL